MARSSPRSSESIQIPPDGYLPGLDAVRGVAILLVILYHSVLQVRGTYDPTVLVDWWTVAVGSAGWSGVDLFFVLSGFLITRILLNARNSPTYFRSFYVRRVLRIFPLYYAALIVAFVLLPAVGMPVRPDQTHWFWAHLSNLRMTLLGHEGVSMPLIHFWSLSVEEQFYLLWPVVVLRLQPKTLLRLCVGMVVGSILLRAGAWWVFDHPSAAYFFTLARLDGLAAGAAIAALRHIPGGVRAVGRWIRPVGLAGAVAVVVLLFSRGTLRAESDAVVSVFGTTALVALYVWLLVATITARRASLMDRCGRSYWLGSLGRYSYAVYIVHWPLLFLIPRPMVFGPGGTILPGVLLHVLVLTTLSLVVAVLSFHILEQPFLRLKRLFPYGPSPPARADG